MRVGYLGKVYLEVVIEVWDIVVSTDRMGIILVVGR